MANFKDMAMALAQKNSIDTDAQLSELKNQKDSALQFFNLQIAQAELQKNEQNAVQNQMKADEKRNKLKMDLITKFMEQEGQGGNIAIGDDMIGQLAGEQVSPDAQGLPILDGIA